MRLNRASLAARLAQGRAALTRSKQVALLALAAAFVIPAEAGARDIGDAQAPVLLAQAQVRTHRPPNEIDWELVQRIYGMICRAGIREPKIVMSQAILETGWFRNARLMAMNNVFGFRHRQYLTFDSLEASVAFYKDWQDSRWQDSDPSYFHFLERVRYAVPGYTRHVRKIGWDEECPAAAPPVLTPASRKSTTPSDAPGGAGMAKDPGRL